MCIDSIETSIDLEIYTRACVLEVAIIDSSKNPKVLRLNLESMESKCP